MKTEEKTILRLEPKTRLIPHPNNRKSIKSSTTMFQSLKIALMLLSAQET